MYFEKVSKYKDIDIPMPQRKTKYSAGYDFVVAEDIIVPSWGHANSILASTDPNKYEFDYANVFNAFLNPEKLKEKMPEPKTLDEMASLTKASKVKPTLVSTGMKCKLPEDKYLALYIRSSCPLKYWLLLANSTGIIDADYYNNPDNEGEIFFQIINFSPFDIQLKRGDIIGQGIIQSYYTVDDDIANGERIGGFGSTQSNPYNIHLNPEIVVDEKTLEIFNSLGNVNIVKD